MRYVKSQLVLRVSRGPILLVGLAALLALAVGAVFWGQAITPGRSFNGMLQNTFPESAQVPDWSMRFLPVAESAEMQRAVGEMLNFDQATFARYGRGSIEVSLYAAYWSPGKMSHRLIAVHTPDVCWAGAGWERIEARQMPLSAADGGRGLPGEATKTVLSSTLKELMLAGMSWEYREFTLSGRTEYVVFLHLVGGRAMNYGVQGVPPWYSALGDLLARGLRQREEQFFVRISGNRPLPEVLATEPVRQFLQKFEREALLSGQVPAKNRS